MPWLVRDHPELRADPPIPVGVGDRELVRRHRRQTQGKQPNPRRLGGLRGGAPQPGEVIGELGTRRCHAGGGLHLTTAQFQL
jgi:hypothetical protein